MPACSEGIILSRLQPCMIVQKGRELMGLTDVQELNEHGEHGEDMVDLTPYANTSALTVPHHFSVERAYHIFRSMGLRHLTVVDDNNRIQGIVTRKDLLGYRLDAAVQKADSLSGL